MIFFTADNHFGHISIIDFCNRPFSSEEEMDEEMIARWNARVTGSDTVFILGDLLFRSKDPEAILKRLKGKKRLIVGNHDGTWIKKVDISKYFLSVDSYLETSDGQHKLTLCHYPLLSWNRQHRSYMIHGHIHNDTSLDYWPQVVVRENLLNAGCDLHDYAPVTFDELLRNNQLFKQKEQIQRQLAGVINLSSQAYQEYSSLVCQVESGDLVDETSIERLLDSLMDFCPDARFLDLYKRTCRHIIKRYPLLVQEHIQIYRKLYGDEDGTGDD